VTARLLKYTGIAILLVLIAMFAAAWWLTRTEPGARWLWSTATGYIPGELGAASVAGSLAGGLELLDLDYRSEGIDVDAGRIGLALDLVLFPEVRINVRELAAEGVLVRQKETERQEPGEPILPRLSLPFELNVQRLVLADLRVVGSAGEELVAIRNAEAAGWWREAIAVTQLRVESAGGRIEGSMRLGLSPPHPTDLEVGVSHEFPVNENAVQPVRLALRADGTLEDLNIDLEASEPALSVTGTVQRLLEEPGWNLRAQAAYLQWPLASPQPQVYLRQLDLESSGSVDDYSVAADGRVSVVGKDELAFSVVANGNGEALDVASLELDGPPLQATASGALRWADGFAVEVDADVRRLDPSVLTAEWPAGAPVEGVVDAAWSGGRIRMDEVRARVPATGAALDATGVVDPERGIIDVDLDWRNLRWPVLPAQETETVRYESEFGVVRVGGEPDAWQFGGRLAFAAGELPQGVFQLTGSGNRDEVQATLERSEVLSGTAEGDVAFNWRDGGSWSAQLRTEGVQLDPLLPEWPGSLTGEFATAGKLQPLEFEADIAHLEGTVRNHRFVAEGGLSYAAGDVGAEQLQIRAGDSYLEANGRLRSSEGLSFTTEVDSIGRYYADVAGSLQGSGNVSLAEAFPRVRLDLQARDLLWRDYGLKELSVTDQGMPPGEPVALAAEGRGLNVGTRQFDSFSLRLIAAEDDQRLELEVSPAGETIGIGVRGAFENPREPRSGWSGMLQSLRLEAPGVASFALEQPAPLYLSPERVSVGRTCLVGNAEARLCFGANWHGGTAVAAEAELDSLPVDLLRLLVDTDLELTQTLDGILRFSNLGGPASAAGLLEISAGSIRSPVDPQRTLETGPGRLRFDLADGRTLSGGLTLPFAATSEIDARFALGNVNEGAKSPLEGEVRIDLADIGLAAELVPMLETAGGRLDLAVTFDGTLESPHWAGDVLLQDGAVTYSPLGVSLEDVQLEGHADQAGRIEIASTFRAGEGRGEIRSTSDTLAEGLELSVSGDDLTLVDLPDLSVTTNLDLGIRLQGDRLVVNGGVLVPRARITPVNLTSDHVSESDDVVILGETAAETEAADGDERPFAVVGTLGLQLGRDVVVDLDVAEARLTGTTAFTWNGPPMPVAHGQYNISGRFEAYGQVLDITEGSIRFPGVSPANPELRIRAEREIFGNPQIRSAGVLVTGTASEPEIEVYTSPATTEDRALTMLVTGSDFNYEQGVGAVDVGTYIAPDLYISYGIGLFERNNVISLRYDIAKGFGIKATSGRRAEGVDLSYTIER
jgi:translocation and assembly module TamB